MLIGELVGIQLVGVLAAIGVGTALHRNGALWMPECLATTLIGALVGVSVRFASPKLSQELFFSSELFSLVLLPVIVFEAGFGLQVSAYARNTGGILMFSIFGTLISTAAIAALLYGVGYAGLSLNLSLPESLAFASLLSATDPVATLSLFSALKVHPDLDALTSGESIGNDAMAIILFRTFSGFVGKGINHDGIIKAAITFATVLGGSVAIGLGAGLLATMLFRASYAPPSWLTLPACCRCGVKRRQVPSTAFAATSENKQIMAARVAQLSSPAFTLSPAAGTRNSAGFPTVVEAEEWGRSPAPKVQAPVPGTPSGSTVVGNPFREASAAAGGDSQVASSDSASREGSAETPATPSRHLRVKLASGSGASHAMGVETATAHDRVPRSGMESTATSVEAFPLNQHDSPGSPSPLATPGGAITTMSPHEEEHARLVGSHAEVLSSYGAPMGQAAVMLMVAYGSYICAEIGQLSGIVAILIAGVAMQRYTTLLMQPEGVRVAKALLRKLSSLADCVVFFSIGLDVAIYADVNVRADFVAWAVLACVLSRALNVFPIAAIVNAVSWCARSRRVYRQRPDDELKAAEAGASSAARGPAAGAPGLAIPFNFQMLLWHAGLRGAIAYASAISFPGPQAAAVQSCTSAVVLVTSVVMGLSVLPMLNLLNVPYDHGDGRTGYEHLETPPAAPLGCAAVAELGVQRLLAGNEAFVARYGVSDEKAVARQVRAAAVASGGTGR